jgi:nicotinamidase-related amidase
MPRRALLVIDAQNVYFTGRLPITYPDRSESLKRILSAMEAAQTSGIPVIVVQHGAPESSPLMAQGSEDWQLHPEVATRPRALLLEKTFPGSFTGTELEAWLRKRDIDTLAVAGYMSQNCVDSTIRQAVHLGFSVEYLQDASGTLALANHGGSASAEEIHRITCVVMQSRFAAVMETEAWLAMIKQGCAPLRETLLIQSRPLPSEILPS